MSVKILVGDVREKLSTLPSKSVQCVVTSIPYWALRDYGTGTWEGGDPACKHVQLFKDENKGVGGGYHAKRGKTCKKCGASLKADLQIGLESTLDGWVETMLRVSNEVWRVLRDDGTYWMNVGDNYCAQPQGDLKQKDLTGQGWALAFAMRRAGWYLRSTVIWHKPNVLPESVTDRPSTAHEYVFMLTKSSSYYYDAEAVRTSGGTTPQQLQSYAPQKDYSGSGVQVPGDVRKRTIEAMERNGGRANLRTVWTVPHQASELGHFATFPEKLVEPCVKASTSERGACRKCGAPWKRVVVLDADYAAAIASSRGAADGDLHTGTGMKARKDKAKQTHKRSSTAGWEPTCAHKHVGDPVPCVVLDPFSGSGTTGVVAHWLRRDYVGVELNPEYASASEKRILARPKRLHQESGPPRDRLREMAERLADDPGSAGALARLVLA